MSIFLLVLLVIGLVWLSGFLIFLSMIAFETLILKREIEVTIDDIMTISLINFLGPVIYIIFGISAIMKWYQELPSNYKHKVIYRNKRAKTKHILFSKNGQS